jgi:hypothetical protein
MEYGDHRDAGLQNRLLGGESVGIVHGVELEDRISRY